MRSQASATTRLDDYIVEMLPWAHGHRREASRDFVQAIIAQQTGCQAQLARHFGNQEAAVKRLSRLVHNERLEPRHLADAMLLQALSQLPTHGPIRLATDWTVEGAQHLLVVSLLMGRRAVPIYWRAYDASVLKGRMKRYEHAVIRRVVTRMLHKVGRRRVRVTAARGFADVALFTLLTALGVAFVIRVKRSTKVWVAGQWRKLHTLRFPGNTRRRTVGHLLYCARNLQLLWITMSRARDTHGQWASGIWSAIGPIQRPKPRQSMRGDRAVKRACGTRNGGWALPRHASKPSLRGRGCLPWWPSRCWSWQVWRPGCCCGGPSRRRPCCGEWHRAAVDAVS
jgi:hypothetical protein